MRLSVDPETLIRAVGSVHDLVARVAGLDISPVGTLVAAGMPGSVSAALAAETVEGCGQELHELARDLAAHADQLCLAADEYDSTEHSVAGHLGSPS